MVTFPPKHFLSSRFTASDETTIQSKIFLPWKNHLWNDEMILGPMEASLEARLFVVFLN